MYNIDPKILRKNIEFNNLVAKNFIALTDEEKKEVLQMRNADSVRSWMKNSNLLSFQEHLNFIKKLEDKPCDFYWLVMEGSTNSKYGVIYVNNIDWKAQSCEFGIYANPFLSHIKGKGTLMANMELYIIFEIMGLTSVFLDVQTHNSTAISLYENCGFVRINSNDQDFVKMVLLKKDYYGNK